VVKAIGIVVAEVVTNSYDHAFPGGRRGSISVSVHCSEGDVATMTVSDDGTGFPAKTENCAASWLYDGQLHLIAAGRACHLCGLELAIAPRRRRDFHRCSISAVACRVR
jgi:DNA topoisomerase VI subunit B